MDLMVTSKAQISPHERLLEDLQMNVCPKGWIYRELNRIWKLGDQLEREKDPSDYELWMEGAGEVEEAITGLKKRFEGILAEHHCLKYGERFEKLGQSIKSNGPIAAKISSSVLTKVMESLSGLYGAVLRLEEEIRGQRQDVQYRWTYKLLRADHLVSTMKIMASDCRMFKQETGLQLESLILALEDLDQHSEDSASNLPKPIANSKEFFQVLDHFFSPPGQASGKTEKFVQEIEDYTTSVESSEERPGDWHGACSAAETSTDELANELRKFEAKLFSQNGTTPPMLPGLSDENSTAIAHAFRTLLNNTDDLYRKLHPNVERLEKVMSQGSNNANANNIVAPLRNSIKDAVNDLKKSLEELKTAIFVAKDASASRQIVVNPRSRGSGSSQSPPTNLSPSDRAPKRLQRSSPEAAERSKMSTHRSERKKGSDH